MQKLKDSTQTETPLILTSLNWEELYLFYVNNYSEKISLDLFKNLLDSNGSNNEFTKQLSLKLESPEPPFKKSA